MGSFTTLDYVIFAIYAIVILSVGLFVSRNKKDTKKTAEDYFLAGKDSPMVGYRFITHCCQYIGRTVCGNVRFGICRRACHRIL